MRSSRTRRRNTGYASQARRWRHTSESATTEDERSSIGGNEGDLRKIWLSYRPSILRIRSLPQRKGARSTVTGAVIISDE